jgi:intermediate cleaving peptidase 55
MVPSTSKLHHSMNEYNEAASTSHSSVKEIFNADDALSLSTFSSHLRSLLSHFTNIYIDAPIHSSRRKATWLFNYLTNSLLSDRDDLADVLSSSHCLPIPPYLGELRSIKSLAEQAVMRAAADISARAHTKVRAFPL